MWPNRSAQEVPKRSETESSTKTRDDGAHSRDKVDDDEHDDEHDKEDDDDATSNSKVSSKKIRSVQRSV